MVKLTGKKSEWIGTRLVSTAPVANRMATWPEGTVWTVVAVPGGKVELQGDPCPHCGVRPNVLVHCMAHQALTGFRLAALAALLLFAPSALAGSLGGPPLGGDLLGPWPAVIMWLCFFVAALSAFLLIAEARHNERRPQ